MIKATLVDERLHEPEQGQLAIGSRRAVPPAG